MKKTKGVTLVALVVTIVVLLILVSVSVATLTGDDGIIKNANNSKEETNIAEETDALELATIHTIESDGAGRILKDNLIEQLNEVLGGASKYKLSGDTAPFTVTINKTGNKYTIDAAGKVSYVE